MKKIIYIGLIACPTLWAQDADWISTSSSDMNTTTNWSPTVIPTGIATFDSTIPSIVTTSQITSASIALQNISFPHAADSFTFTVSGANSLMFSGSGCGIIGTNTNTTLNANLISTTSNVPQLIFSGNNATIGDATITASIDDPSIITNTSSTADLASILFDGSGDSVGHSTSISMTSSTASITATTTGNIAASTYSLNNVGVILFDGSGGLGLAAAGTGSMDVNIAGNITLDSNLAGDIKINNINVNNLTQILFDGSGGLSGVHGGTGQLIATVGGSAQITALTSGLGQIYNHASSLTNHLTQICFDGSGGMSFGAGGQGSAVVLLKGSASMSATTNNELDNQGYATDLAQVLFSGSGGYSSGGAGIGSCDVTITDSFSLTATNTYYIRNDPSAQYLSNEGQILFDGSGGFSYGSSGTGSINVLINGQAQITALAQTNSSYIYTDAAYQNDLGQIIFDGSAGLNYIGGGIGSCVATIADDAQIMATNEGFIYSINSYVNDVAQILFDGSGGFSYGGSGTSSLVLSIRGNAIVNASNIVTGNIDGAANCNDVGQIIFDGSSGFEYGGASSGFANISLSGAAQILANNIGTIGAASSGNNFGQILFDGSGASGYTSYGSGNCTLLIEDTVTIQGTNSGTIGGTGTSNNIAQILFDGSGGSSIYGSPGHGNMTLTINTTTPISATNTGTITNTGSSTSNKIAQIVFDGSHGYGSQPSTGTLAITMGDSVTIEAINSGTINSNGTSAQGIGQILFDGNAGSGSGSCIVNFGNNNTIYALNESSGTVSNGSQIGFYDVVTTGQVTAIAVNQIGGTPQHGVSFYGPSCSASGVNVFLTNTTLYADSTLSPSFTIGALSGDVNSSALFDQSISINPNGNSATFSGNIAGLGFTLVGSGQQILAGTNSYSGATNVSSGTLTLINSNIPGTLTVSPEGSFTGTGTISGTTQIFGTIKPGNSPGTLNFLSGITIAPSATTVIELSPSLGSLLAVSGGNAQIAGQLSIIEDSGVTLGSTYEIISVAGGDALGYFSKISYSGDYFPMALYDSNEVRLTLINAPMNFAVMLSSPDRILRNSETLKHLSNRREHTVEAFKNPATVALLVANDSSEGKPFVSKETDTPIKEWSVYFQPLGSFGHVNSTSKVIGNSFQTVGGRIGFDRIWTNEDNSHPLCYGVGLIGEYTYLWSQINHNAGRFTSNQAYGSLYGTMAPKAAREFSINLIAGGGYEWYQMKRYPFSNSITAKSSPGGSQADVMLDFEYAFTHHAFKSLPEHFRLTPLAGLQYTYCHINSYLEEGAGIYDLKMESQTSNTLSTLLGFRMNHLFLAGSDVTVRPEIQLGWQYQYLNSSVNTSIFENPTFAPGEVPVTIQGFAPNSLIAGADIQVGLFDIVTIELSYDLWYNKSAIDNFFLLEINTQF